MKVEVPYRQPTTLLRVRVGVEKNGNVQHKYGNERPRWQYATSEGGNERPMKIEEAIRHRGGNEGQKVEMNDMVAIRDISGFRGGNERHTSVR